MKILLVDDHALFLEGLKTFLEVQGIQVVGIARNGAEALLKYEMLKPDLILMDLQMVQCDGIETTRMIKKEYPEATIVMLTACEDEDNLFASIQAGASGYLLKGMEPEQFLEQLLGLSQGEMPLAPCLAGRVLKEFLRQQHAPALVKRNEKGKGNQELTERQHGILKFLAEGLSYKEIAEQLELKEVTIKYHINEILTKLHLANRSQLIAYFLKKGLL